MKSHREREKESRKNQRLLMRVATSSGLSYAQGCASHTALEI